MNAIRPNRLVYLDNHATTACDPRALAAMLPWFTELPGNPASTEHAAGRAASEAVEQARAHIAALIGADPREIILTSGATESNNLAIKGAARFHAAHGDGSRRRLIAAATEHKCVLQSFADLASEGFEPIILPVGPDGLLDPDLLRQALQVPTLLVSIMAVNNEIGVIQDLATLAPLVHAAGAILHSDAAQAAAKIPIDVENPRIDLLSLSAHKMYGPKGIGALYVRRRPRIRLTPLFSGGGQERTLRSGTLPTPLIVGFGEAARIAQSDLTDDAPRIATQRDAFLARLQSAIPGLTLNGHRSARIGGNLNLTFPTSALNIMQASPDLCVSTGSACSTASIEPSYVLRAIGLTDEQAARTLRICIGRTTSAADLDFAAEALISAATINKA